MRGDSSRGQLTHHTGTDTGKGSTCWVTAAGLMYACLPLMFDRGTITPFPVTPEECRVRFLLRESCPLTCHHHTDTISSFSFPLGRGILQCVCVCACVRVCVRVTPRLSSKALCVVYGDEQAFIPLSPPTQKTREVWF